MSITYFEKVPFGDFDPIADGEGKSFLRMDLFVVLEQLQFQWNMLRPEQKLQLKKEPINGGKHLGVGETKTADQQVKARLKDDDPIESDKFSNWEFGQGKHRNHCNV